MSWRGNECKVFNVGKYRRQVQKEVDAAQEMQGIDALRQSVGACDANFFDSKNPKAQEMRQKSAALAMKDMLEWLDYAPPIEEHSGDVINDQIAGKASIDISRVAIFDATNSTIQRRMWILEEATDPVKRRGKKTGCVFVESVCDDNELLDENFRFKVRPQYHLPAYGPEWLRPAAPAPDMKDSWKAAYRQTTSL